ncbi:MAG: metallophosphoesterase family protein [Candidatus Xenobia bacterium]
MKFVHAADLHIDSPLLGLEQYEGAPRERIREATREAFRNVVRTCLVERAAFLVLAGDVFDGEWKDFNTAQFFVKELSRLGEAGCRVFLVRGNHDARSELTSRLRYPPHVREFSAADPETVCVDDLGVALHGMSFPRRDVTENLALRYPPRLEGYLNVGLLHTNAIGSSQHDPYAPCKVGDLVDKGYDYWALGHVHTAEILHREPWVVYPGNTQGRHVREPGAKGCVVVTVEGGEVRRVARVETDVVRFSEVSVVLGPEDGKDEAFHRATEALALAREAADGRLAAVRLTLRGRCRGHAALLDHDAVVAQVRADAMALGEDVWLEKVRIATDPPESHARLAAGEGLVAELLRQAAATAQDPAALALLSANLEDLQGKVGLELRRAGLDLSSPQVLRELLGEAEALLVARLMQA